MDDLVDAIERVVEHRAELPQEVALLLGEADTLSYDELQHTIARLIRGEPDDVVLGGGNVKKFKTLPPGCRASDNANAFIGGFRLWATKTTAHRFSKRPLPKRSHFRK